jgi:hypothetical protein
MKRSLLVLFILLGFLSAKADFLRKDSNTLQAKIVIIPINALPDYNVSFKVNPYCYFPYWNVEPVPSKQNRTAVLNYRKVEIEKVNLLKKS